MRESCIRQHNKQFAECQAGTQSKWVVFSARFSSILCVLFNFFLQRITTLFVCWMCSTSIKLPCLFCISFVCFQINLFVVRCRFGSRIVAPNGGVKRNRKVCVLVCRIFRNCRIEWHAMVAVCRWIRGYHRHFYPHCQVNDCHLFTALTFAPKCSSIIFQSLQLGFLSHPQNVYPSYLTPPLSLAPSNMAMSSLGLSHHGNASNLRISPQSMAAMQPQNMRLSSPQHSLNGPSMATHQMMAGHRHTPPSQMSLPPPLMSSIPVSDAASTSPASSVHNSLPTVSSPQNLSLSPNQNAANRLPSASNNSRMLSSNSSSPHNPNDKKPLDESDSSVDMNQVSGKEIALNMTMNNTDMRTNSIATLRIKAKEHLESINKGLAIA